MELEQQRGRSTALLSAAEHARAAALKPPGTASAGSWRERRCGSPRRAPRLDPEDVAFVAGPQGKPECPATRLRFNLGHSGERAVVALAEDVEVGVDVERTGRTSRAVERTLSDGERAARR